MKDIIKPFQGAVYNLKKFKTLERLVCPPYDVIDARLAARLRAASRYNYIHVLLPGKAYAAAGRRFRSWFKEHVFLDDLDDALYLYSQDFSWGHKKYSRLGLIGLLRMDSGVYGHEHTLAKPKQDRSRLIRQVKANLSPIFVLVPRRVDRLHQALARRRAKKPTLYVKDFQGITNRVWKITGAEARDLAQAMSAQSMVIADGHHRFEISYDYFRKSRGKYKDINYLMAYFTDAQDGLLVLPTHRVVAIKEPCDEAVSRLSLFFDIQPIKFPAIDKALAGQDKRFRFVFYMGGQAYLMRLKSTALLSKMEVPADYKRLNTYLLHNLVFKLVTPCSQFAYTHSAAQAQVLAGKDKAAFIINAVPLDLIFSMARKGYKFPQKSTYFYPKVLSGLVLRRFKSK